MLATDGRTAYLLPVDVVSCTSISRSRSICSDDIIYQLSSLCRYTGVILGHVVTMLGGSGRTIEVIRGRGMQFACARSPTLKSTNRQTPETYQWTALNRSPGSVGRIVVRCVLKIASQLADLILPARQNSEHSVRAFSCQTVQMTLLISFVALCS